MSTNLNVSSSKQLILNLCSHLSTRRRWQLIALLNLMLISGVLELISLGTVLPFLAVLINPSRLWDNYFIQIFVKWSQFTSPNQLITPITIAFATSAILTAGIRLANLWLNGRMAAAIGSDFSCEAYRKTLYQPYSVHVQRNSSDVITTITSRIAETVSVINSTLRLITALIVSISLLIGLLLINWTIAALSAFLFGSAYIIMALLSQRELISNSRRINLAGAQLLKALQEGLGAIRDVLLNGNEETYLEIYQKADRPQRRLAAKNIFISSFPRYTLEALGICLIALMGSILVKNEGSEGEVIPLLGALALGAQRLLPSLQQIYSGWATVKGGTDSLEGVLQMLELPMPKIAVNAQIMPFIKKLCFQDVKFRYNKDLPEVLSGLDFEIHRGERIGIIGSTGSGKSTTVDLLMGLLPPTSGTITIDGVDLHDINYPHRVSEWRAAIAHVPQEIYLTDSSIAENIAFGLNEKEIDMQRVRKVARQAQISGFIESSQSGYETFVGERGIRLSGGQRQRIGIARALYKNAKILVFDEATSSLDNTTENALMRSIESLSRDLTIVMIAHRLTTVERCDRVIHLKDGVVSDNGPPSKVLSSF